MTERNDLPGVLFYTRIRKSPFFYASRRHGPKLYSFASHMYHPRLYTDPVEEYWQLLEGVTLWDVGVERLVEITGPDAFTFTNMLCARDLSKCVVGQCKYVLMTAADGGIVNDPVLQRMGDNHFWLSCADSEVNLWAKGVAVNSGLDVTIGEPDIGTLQVQGPRSKDVMVDLFGERLLDLPYYYFREYELDGMDVVVARTGYSLEIGYEIYLREASRLGMQLWDAVWEAGKQHGMTVIGPCHIRRIEGGILSYGADMGLDTNPYEVAMGYDWMVDLDEEKDDFIGKAALKEIKEEGVKRRLVGVEIAGDSLGSYIDGSMADYFPVYHDRERVGKVTSACYSPRLEKNIGYAMVPIDLEGLGTELEVEAPSGRTTAVVAEKPFIDPNKEAVKEQLVAR